MPRLCTLADLDLEDVAGRAVFVRVDYNVPRSGENILDTTRLEESLPTLEELSGAGARILLYSHCGRPRGKRVPELSLRPVAEELSRLVSSRVIFGEDCIGPEALAAASQTEAGGLCVLENLRFHPGEESNDGDFARQLGSLAHVYVDDAFACVHRDHASITGVPAGMEVAVAGRLLEREVLGLGKLLADPERPFVAILGGAKIRGKIATLRNLLPRLDALLVGGAMANTFLVSTGLELGRSLIAEDELESSTQLLAEAEKLGVEVVLPRDLVVTDRSKSSSVAAEGEEPPLSVAVESVPASLSAVDIGLETLTAFEGHLAGAGTIFWNGPVGLFEDPPFDSGSLRLASAVANSEAFSVAGGGETVAVLKRAGIASKLSHVSTGGGASLAFLAGQRLPGISILEEVS